VAEALVRMVMRAAVRRGLRRVQQQVHEDLVDLLRLALDGGQLAVLAHDVTCLSWCARIASVLSMPSCRSAKSMSARSMRPKSRRLRTSAPMRSTAMVVHLQDAVDRADDAPDLLELVRLDDLVRQDVLQLVRARGAARRGCCSARRAAC
jgi:hypothetical protein